MNDVPHTANSLPLSMGIPRPCPGSVRLPVMVMILRSGSSISVRQERLATFTAILVSTRGIVDKVNGLTHGKPLLGAVA